MQQLISIAEFEVNKPARSRLMVTEKSLKAFRDKEGYYLSLSLMDRTGRIEARIWEQAEEWNEKIHKGSVIEAKGMVGSWKDRVAFNIQQLAIIPENAVDPSDFLPSCPKDVAYFYTNIQKWIAEINHAGLERLLRYIFIDSEMATKFTECIGGRSVHHAYIGGLLEHTHNVTLLARGMAKIYDLDFDLITAGALLHDIGKIEAYEWRTGFDLTLQGKMVDHIMLGAMLVDRVISELDIHLDEELKWRLLHMIGSHHGKREHGSPIPPMTLEGYVLHIADLADSGVNKIQSALESTNEEGWTNERILLLGESVQLFRGQSA